MVLVVHFTYFWEKSTTSSVSGFSVISGANSSTYDPPSVISQTTWYRRGYYRCNINDAYILPQWKKTVAEEATAGGQINGAEQQCTAYNPGNNSVRLMLQAVQEVHLLISGNFYHF